MALSSVFFFPYPGLQEASAALVEILPEDVGKALCSLWHAATADTEVSAFINILESQVTRRKKPSNRNSENKYIIRYAGIPREREASPARNPRFSVRVLQHFGRSETVEETPSTSSRILLKDGTIHSWCVQQVDTVPLLMRNYFGVNSMSEH